MSLKQKIVAIVIALGLILIGIFTFGLYPKTVSAPISESHPTQAQPDNSGVKVVGGNISTNQVSTISPTQDLEVTFNKPMVQDNTRISIDPRVGYRTELSSDHHTIKIIPDKSFDLGK